MGMLDGVYSLVLDYEALITEEFDGVKGLVLDQEVLVSGRFDGVKSVVLDHEALVMDRFKIKTDTVAMKIAKLYQDLEDGLISLADLNQGIDSCNKEYIEIAEAIKKFGSEYSALLDFLNRLKKASKEREEIKEEEEKEEKAREALRQEIRSYKGASNEDDVDMENSGISGTGKFVSVFNISFI